MEYAKERSMTVPVNVFRINAMLERIGEGGEPGADAAYIKAMLDSGNLTVGERCYVNKDGERCYVNKDGERQMVEMHGAEPVELDCGTLKITPYNVDEDVSAADIKEMLSNGKAVMRESVINDLHELHITNEVQTTEHQLTLHCEKMKTRMYYVDEDGVRQMKEGEALIARSIIATPVSGKA